MNNHTHNDPFYGDYDPEEDLCDSCSEPFPIEDLKAHDDGNWYCPECWYPSKEDKLDALVDSCDV